MHLADVQAIRCLGTCNQPACASHCGWAVLTVFCHRSALTGQPLQQIIFLLSMCCCQHVTIHGIRHAVPLSLHGCVMLPMRSCLPPFHQHELKPICGKPTADVYDAMIIPLLSIGNAMLAAGECRSRCHNWHAAADWTRGKV